MNQASNNKKLVVPGAKQAIDSMKYEIAREFGVNLGPDATSRAVYNIFTFSSDKF